MSDNEKKMTENKTDKKYLSLEKIAEFSVAWVLAGELLEHKIGSLDADNKKEIVIIKRRKFFLDSVRRGYIKCIAYDEKSFSYFLEFEPHRIKNITDRALPRVSYHIKPIGESLNKFLLPKGYQIVELERKTN